MTLKTGLRPVCFPCERVADAEVVNRYNAYRTQGTDLSIPCLAPLTNMYFQYNGVVAPCCHNTRIISGIYPHNSIREIWNEMQKASLANSLRNNDFSDGCGLCVPDLMMENFASTRFGGYDVHGPSAEMPHRMEFNISNQCNLECAMCYGGFSSMIRKNRECLPPVQSPYGEQFFSELSEFIPALHEARFSGGETFLIPEYFRIWDMIAKLNPECGITVVTNGTVMNHAVKKSLESGQILCESFSRLIKCCYAAKNEKTRQSRADIGKHEIFSRVLQEEQLLVRNHSLSYSYELAGHS